MSEFLARVDWLLVLLSLGCYTLGVGAAWFAWGRVRRPRVVRYVSEAHVDSRVVDDTVWESYQLYRWLEHGPHEPLCRSITRSLDEERRRGHEAGREAGRAEVEATWQSALDLISRSEAEEPAEWNLTTYWAPTTWANIPADADPEPALKVGDKVRVAAAAPRYCGAGTEQVGTVVADEQGASSPHLRVAFPESPWGNGHGLTSNYHPDDLERVSLA